MVGGEHDRLPERALVALRIAHQHEHAAGRTLQARRERAPHAHGEALPERAGGEVDAGERVLGMDAEQAPVGAVAVEGVLGEPAAEEERRVDGQHGVALGEDEAVPLRIREVPDAQHPPIERGDDVRDRERRADVADPRALRLLEDDPPDAGRRQRARLHGLSHAFTPVAGRRRSSATCGGRPPPGRARRPEPGRSIRPASPGPPRPRG